MRDLSREEALFIATTVLEHYDVIDEDTAIEIVDDLPILDRALALCRTCENHGCADCIDEEGDR
jgi:hypothetical protein